MNDTGFFYKPKNDSSTIKLGSIKLKFVKILLCYT